MLTRYALLLAYNRRAIEHNCLKNSFKQQLCASREAVVAEWPTLKNYPTQGSNQPSVLRVLFLVSFATVFNAAFCAVIRYNRAFDLLQ